MFRSIATAAVLAATAIGGIAAPAQAQRWGQGGYHDGYRGQYGGGQDGRGYDGRGYGGGRGYDGYYGRGPGDRGYYGRSGYYGRGGNYYGRGYRCRDRGDGGLAIGAIAGGLLGNTVAGRGDRLLGTVVGAGVGGLAGRAIDRSDGRRC